MRVNLFDCVHIAQCVSEIFVAVPPLLTYWIDLDQQAVRECESRDADKVIADLSEVDDFRILKHLHLFFSEIHFIRG